MLETEEMIVIDGHKIDSEYNELPLINDVREIYDINLSNAINNCNNNFISHEFETNKNNWNINTNISDRDIIQIEDTIYEIITNRSTLSVKIYGKNSLIFEFETDKEFKLDKKKYGKDISTENNLNYRYYQNGDTTVISSDLTNKIIKYSSSEIINNHIYTKYYEFLDDDISVYLLLIDFIPYKMTTYHKNNKYDTLNFNYNY